MASKDISSYFAKPSPSTPGTKRPASSVTGNGTGSSPVRTSSQPTPTPGSSGKPKASGLSEAMRKAILEGVQEGESEREAKRSKIEVEKKPIASLFASAATNKSPASKLILPAAKTKEELVDNLSSHPETKALLQLELDTLDEDWLLALQDELTKPYFISLKAFVTKEQQTKKVFPPANDIYSWSRLCPLKDVRVVIIGQDPYHDDGQAHGFAFSVRKGVRVPPSLRNMYKELSDEIPGFTIPKHGDLTEWAKHGVLLLNTSLTVRAHEAGSHSKHGWETFTAAILRVITSRLSPSQDAAAGAGAHGVVFMAWGKHAQTMASGIDKKKHLVLSSAHPSPFAAMKGFFGNGHFVKANEWLEERYGEKGGIDWASLGAQE